MSRTPSCGPWLGYIFQYGFASFYRQAYFAATGKIIETVPAGASSASKRNARSDNTPSAGRCEYCGAGRSQCCQFVVHFVRAKICFPAIPSKNGSSQAPRGAGRLRKAISPVCKTASCAWADMISISSAALAKSLSGLCVMLFPARFWHRRLRVFPRCVHSRDQGDKRG